MYGSCQEVYCGMYDLSGGVLGCIGVVMRCIVVYMICQEVYWGVWELSGVGLGCLRLSVSMWVT